MATFTAKPIDALPAAASLQDGSIIPICQDGTAKQITGAQLKAFAVDAVAGESAKIANMAVEATTLAPGAEATVEKGVVDATGAVKLIFGLPQGATGAQGPKGEGFTISGKYDTIEEVLDPLDGHSYFIGASAPYDVYTYCKGVWINNGPLQMPTEAILYTIQSLTEEQQIQARANIGVDQAIAAALGDVGAVLDAINGEVV